MTKPTNWLCAQRRLRSAILISLHCPHKEILGPWLPIERTAKTLIRLGGCPVWSKSSLGAYSLCWFCHVAARMYSEMKQTSLSSHCLLHYIIQKKKKKKKHSALDLHCFYCIKCVTDGIKSTFYFYFNIIYYYLKNLWVAILVWWYAIYLIFSDMLGR